MYRSAALLMTMLMLFSGLAGAMAPVGGPLTTEVRTAAIDLGADMAPMDHNGSDQMKYDAKDYDISVTFDQTNHELTGYVQMTLTTLRTIDQFNLTIIGSLAVGRVRDGALANLQYHQNRTLDLLTVNLTAPVAGGTDLTFHFDFSGNVSESMSKDTVHWNGTHLEAGTPWFPVPFRPHGLQASRPRVLDLFNATVHVLVPSNWTAVSMGQFVGENAKNYTYQSVDPVRGVSVGAAAYFVNQTTYNGVTISTYKYVDNATQSGAFIDKAKTMLDWFGAHYGTYPYTDFRMVEMREQAQTWYLPDQAMMLTDNINRTTPPVDIANMIADQYFNFNTFPIGNYDAWLSFSFSEYATTYYQLSAEGRDTKLKNNKIGYGSGTSEQAISAIGTNHNRWDEVIYNKGSYVLHMFRYLVGNDTFDAALKAYVTASSGKRSDLDMFMAAVGGATSMDLVWFWDQWLNTTKVLDYSADTAKALVFEEDGQMKFEVLISKKSTAQMPVDIGVIYENDETELWPMLISKDDQDRTIIQNLSYDLREVVVDPGLWLLDTNRYDDKTGPTIDDMVVEDLIVSPISDVTALDEVSLEATVINKGDRTLSVTVGFYDNGTLIDSENVPDLQADSEETVEVTWTAVHGLRNISVYADSDEVIREYNESNNKLNTTVQVAEYIPPPDLYFLDEITPSKENSTEGDTILLNITVFSAYKLPINGVSVVYSVDGKLLTNVTLGTIGSNSSAVASATWPTVAGTHTITAALSPPAGVTESDTTNNDAELQVKINAIPVAKLEVDENEPFTGEEVEFSAVQSFDDTKVAAYYFDFGDGNIKNWSASAITKYKYTASGQFQAKVKVRDNLGIESLWSDPVDLDVQNTRPYVEFDVEPDEQGDVTTTFTFTSTATDPDGEVVEYKWEFGSEATSSEESPSYRFKDDLDYEVKLTVKDDDGAWSLPFTMTIVIENLRPVAKGTMSVTTAYVGDKVTLDATQTEDPDDDFDKLSFKWLADGRTISSRSKDTLVSFNTPGTYTIELTVTDDDGDSNTVEIGDIVVKERPKTDGDDDDEVDNTMLYVGAGGGIAALVIIIVLFMFMRGAAAKKKAAAATKRPKKKTVKKAKKKAGDKDEEVEEVEALDDGDEPIDEEDEGGEEE